MHTITFSNKSLKAAVKLLSLYHDKAQSQEYRSVVFSVGASGGTFTKSCVSVGRYGELSGTIQINVDVSAFTEGFPDLMISFTDLESLSKKVKSKGQTELTLSTHGTLLHVVGVEHPSLFVEAYSGKADYREYWAETSEHSPLVRGAPLGTFTRHWDYAASYIPKDDYRPSLRGIVIAGNGTDKYRLMGSDGYSLGMATTYTAEDATPLQWEGYAPSKHWAGKGGGYFYPERQGVTQDNGGVWEGASCLVYAEQLSKVFDALDLDDSTEVEVNLSGADITFHVGSDLSFSAMLPTHKVYEWRGVWYAQCEKASDVTTVNVGEMQAALRAVQQEADETTNAVYLERAEGGLTLRAARYGVDMPRYTVTATVGDGFPENMPFDVRYLARAFASAGTHTARLYTAGSANPITVRAGSVMAIVMPLSR